MENFINVLTGHVYKIIPLKEEELRGDEVFLAEYIDSLSVEVLGALSTYEVLESDPDYTTVRNIINYLNTHEFSLGVCKREVFKALKHLNLISDRLGGHV